MRTTLILRDDLIEAAKKRAAERKTTLSAIVDEALMVAVHADTKKETGPTVDLPTYRPPNPTMLDTSPHDMHDLMES